MRAFGEIDSIKASRRKLTTLKVFYDDCVYLLINHKNGTVGSVCIDVVSRKAVRQFELVGEDIYLTWDGTPDSLKLYDAEKKQESAIQLTNGIERQEGYAAFVVENAYADELKAFINAINSDTAPAYGFTEDLETLRLIDMIEAAK